MSITQENINPTDGNNYYRIVSIGSIGSLNYSTEVSIDINGKPGIVAYPNPVINGVIGLKMTSMPLGVYEVHLSDNLGRVLMTTSVNHPGGSATETIVLGKSIPKGNYNLEIVEPGNNKIAISLLNQ